MSVMPLLRKAEKMLHVAASVIIGTSSRAEKNVYAGKLLLLVM